MRRVLLCLLFSLVVCAVSGALGWAAAPVVEEVYVCRGLDHQNAWVRVSDGDGVGDIVSVTITDAAGGDHVKTPDCGCWWQEDDYTVTCGWCEWDLPVPPDAGTYAIAVTDASANTDTLITAAAPEVPGAVPELLVPAHMTAVYETVPTFSWTDGMPGEDYELGLWEEPGDSYWYYNAGSATSVVYNADGTALHEELTRGRVYGWDISVWKCEDCGVSDPRVYIYTWQRAYGRFKVSYLLEPPPPVPIEGKLLVTGDRGTYCMEGDSHTITWLPTFPGASLSPLGDRVLYNDDWFAMRESGEGDVWTAEPDGSNPVNVTELAGLGGINCVPNWSPDANKIVFTHSDPAPGELPCEAGFHVWVINADGTGAHRVTPEGHLPTWGVPSWAPNGYRILCTEYWVDEAGINPGDTISIDEDGTDRMVLPDVGLEPRFSPDGSKIVSHKMPRDVVDGEPGYWRTLELCDSDGTNPQVLLERFVSDSEIQQHMDHTGGGSVWGVVYDVGPTGLAWAPKGDRVALTLCWPFEPLGALYWHQQEVWLCDLSTGQLTQLTDDAAAEVATWSGNNTSSDHPRIRVDNTTVTFDEVTGDGLTTIIRDDEPPGETPEGFQFLGEYYDISTTAEISGIITIEMHYDDADVPGGQEEWLSLLHWETDHWVDITVRPIDTVNNIVTGQCTSLSEFGIAHGPQLAYPLPPINADGSSVFKLGRTVPVKFQLIATDGSFVDDALARLYVDMVSTEVAGTVQEPGTTTEADTGYLFRYDPDANQYIYNLGTKNLDIGTWTLTVVVNDLPPKEVQISLR